MFGPMQWYRPTVKMMAVGVMVLGISSLDRARAHHPDDGLGNSHLDTGDPASLLQRRGDPHAGMFTHDTATAGMVISDGPFADVVKNLSDSDGALRPLADATTDVWAHDGFAYIGTFSNPCGDGTGANQSGIRIFDVHNNNMVGPEVGNIPSVAGSRTNDVKVATMNSGDILVHSNEACAAGGPGGFEIWSVDLPTAPTHLAHVQTDDVNGLLRDGLGFVDFGVHNLFLFTQGAKDYVAAVVESEFGNFQIFDITDPSSPTLVGFWGAESLLFPTVDFATTTDFGGVILPADAYLFSGFGAFQNRFLHDVTISADGSKAYLSNWDAGLVLLDISDPTSPALVSIALDPANGSLDGEVNSHAAWPSEDGAIVVESEEDFSTSETIFEITSGSAAGEYPAIEGAITVPIASLAGSEMAGPTVYAGLACPSDTVPTAPSSGSIALIQRGACDFSDKLNNAETAGYAGVVVFNDAARGEALVLMGGSATNLPGVFVGHSTGLLVAGVATDGDLVVGAAGESVSAATVADAWSGLRVWDYADPANPVLASTFNTVCSANPVDTSCDPRGTYSVHNVIVETTDGTVKAYISWYTDGVLVVDVTDPYNPVEVGRYHREGGDFEAENGGIQDVWGIYKVPDKPWIYASDRNGGLYVLKEYGSGTTGKK